MGGGQLSDKQCSGCLAANAARHQCRKPGGVAYLFGSGGGVTLFQPIGISVSAAAGCRWPYCLWLAISTAAA